MTQTYDYDLIIIGAGSGGIRAARFCSNYGARVAVIESRYLGGTCVNVGCVPKKLLTYAASFGRDAQLAKTYGWQNSTPHNFSWPHFLAQKNQYTEFLHSVYQKTLESSNADLLWGSASFIDSHTLHIKLNDGSEKKLTTKHTLICSGGWPEIPDIPGKELAISSNEFFNQSELPKRVTVIGGGYIAAELATILAGLQCETTLIVRSDSLLKNFDADITSRLTTALKKQKVTIHFHEEASEICKQNDSLSLKLKHSKIETDQVIFAIGRKALTKGLSLEKTQVTLDQKHNVIVNEDFLTADPAISALGDVVGRLALTPVALAEAMAFAKKHFRPDEYQPVNYQKIATAIFTHPEMATIGLSEAAAIKEDKKITVYESEFRDLRDAFDRESTKTYIKIIVETESDKILGLHVLGNHAAEIIQGFSTAINMGATKKDFDNTIGIHPTLAEEILTIRKAKP
jgi:glutathione reductase (NADPH)